MEFLVPSYFIELMLVINIILIIASTILIYKSKQQSLAKIFLTLLAVVFPFIGSILVLTYLFLTRTATAKTILNT